MRYVSLIFLTFFLTSCGFHAVNAKDIALCKKACNPNGGLEEISIFLVFENCYCMNHSSFNMDYLERPRNR